MFFDRGLFLLLRPFSAEMRLMMVKDMRLFRRDPLQWSQFLIFFGLLVIYFLNIQRFTYDISSISWVVWPSRSAINPREDAAAGCGDEVLAGSGGSGSAEQPARMSTAEAKSRQVRRIRNPSLIELA